MWLTLFLFFIIINYASTQNTTSTTTQVQFPSLAQIFIISQSIGSLGLFKVLLSKVY